MSQVHILYEMEEEDSGGRYQPNLYMKGVIGVFVNKDKAIEYAGRLTYFPDSVEVSDRFVNGVEQDIMYWTFKGWRDRVLYKLETQTLIDWE